MGTQLLNIITAIQSWQFTTIGGKAIKAPALADLPSKPAAGDLPMRIIAPTTNRIQAKSSEPMTLRGGRTYEWEIEDLFLFKAVASTDGFTECNLPLVAYIQAYTTALDEHVTLFQGVTVEDAPIEMGIYEYPKGGNTFYAAVCVTLKIKELT